MSTTRHLINRHRRLAAVGAATGPATVAGTATATATTAPAPPTTPRTPARGSRTEPATVHDEDGPATAARRRSRPRPRLRAALLLPALLLGAFAALAAVRTADLDAGSAGRNHALTDPARTGEVRAAVSEAVGSLFSYSFADPARTDRAAEELLTGKAVEQHTAMLAEVRAQAAARRLVLTTTVTDSGVELLTGGRARVVVFADQRNTSTAQGAETGATYAAAMFAVDAVRRDGRWLIEGIDTFGR
ncbi:hypothetical protein [Kitasatospora sp. NBC_01539]|uniref:hypothetical protein n=1 Tax=Kitasatospora sp. NBC_01539 TaxID=2903577 RepID=UPI003860124D